eukprot:m.153465 g.153465  ORF g.153465 m.153465 type:complete len:68 (+) comp20758_c0_seq5:362-565(+)
MEEYLASYATNTMRRRSSQSDRSVTGGIDGAQYEKTTAVEFNPLPKHRTQQDAGRVCLHFAMGGFFS